MTKYHYNFTSLLVALLVAYILAGCTDSTPDSSFRRSDEYLIKVGDRVVTILDFTKALEISKIAYPPKVIRNPVSFKEVQLRLLNQMIEEMILQKRAEELNIKISDAEVEKAVADIKNDYPPGVFEQTFLEQAVSYNSWKKELKIRLLIKKVVAKELEEQITITSEDISKYFTKHYPESGLKSDLKERFNQNITDAIIKQIRREKAENVYKSWIKKLKKKYPIEINQALWEKITGS